MQIGKRWGNETILLIKHLEEAKARDASVIFCGDLFDAMQGRDDKRAMKAALLREFCVDDYFDALVREAADFFAPYAAQICIMGVGNHERKVLERYGANLIERLAEALKVKGGRPYCGGFGGWVTFSFENKSGVFSKAIVLHYDHGFGGGSAITGDMPSHHRRALYLPDAHIIVSGHTHDSWIREFIQRRFHSATGTERRQTQYHLKTPTYHDGYGDEFDSWEAQRGLQPKPTGGYWVEFFYNTTIDEVQFHIIKAN